MTTRDTPWAPGTPCWVDLVSPDQSAAIAYYAAIFGWQVTPGPPETGGYAMAERGGHAVAGIGAMMAPDQPSMWNTYLASADTNATSEAITAAGGTLIAPPMDVLDLGRMLVAQDPTGGVFCVWQAGTHIGAGRVNEPGAPIWNELLTGDYDSAKTFYAAVFGATFTDIGGGDFRFATVEVDGNTVGGIGGADGPAYWRVYFGSSDPDAKMADATRLGGTIVDEAHDTPFGRWGTIADPQGAQFSVITVPDQGS